MLSTTLSTFSYRNSFPPYQRWWGGSRNYYFKWRSLPETTNNMENNYGVGLYREGTFYFTNPGLAKFTDKFNNESTDFTTLWNNKEYTFKGKTTSPLLIPNTTPEEIQNIRKQFAKNYAIRWFFTTKRYKDLVKKGGYIPATYDEDTEYKDVIQACLTPLPKSEMGVKEMPKVKDTDFKSKAISQNDNLENAFRDYDIPVLGQQ